MTDHHRSVSVHGRVLILLQLSLLAACGADTEAPVAPTDATANQWTTTTDNGVYEVTLGPREGKPIIGAFHEWQIGVLDRDGSPVHPARIAFDGGMPAHGHGLPTAPKVTDHLGDGQYRLEGVRFNMAGAWTLMVSVDAAPGIDRAQFEIELGF